MDNNGNAYRVFTVSSEIVTAGAMIETLHLKGAGLDIPAIMVGEEGRGRERGVVPVSNPPMVPCPERHQCIWAPNDTCGKCGVALGEKKVGDFCDHPNSGMVHGQLIFAEVGQTKAGTPKFFSKQEATTNEKIIVVFDTKIGYRGGNEHSGDYVGWQCSRYGCDAAGDVANSLPEVCPKCGAGDWNGIEPKFAVFPGEIIAKGKIAQGDAGRMGNGEQLIALIPKDAVCRAARSGRLYDKPGSHYYKWDGSKLLAATWDERAVTGLF